MEANQQVSDDPCGVSILEGRFKIGKFIDKGSYGVVHEVCQISKPERVLVIKISTNSAMFCQEVEAMQDLEKSDCQNCKIVAFGYFTLGSKSLNFIIMPRYGDNLS